MKILHISNYYYPNRGGIEQVACDIVSAIRPDGVQQKVLCFNETASDGEMRCERRESVVDRVDGVEVVRCGCFAKVASQSLSLSYPRTLKRLMDEFEPDTVILHYPNPFVSFFLQKYIKRPFRLILYWHLDITKQKALGKLFHRQNLKLLDRADRVIATSPNYIDGSPYLRRFRAKTCVIANCVNEKRLCPDESAIALSKEIRARYAGKTICFAVGRHIPYKGMEWLIKASRYLDDAFVILIGGEGPLTDSLKAEAKDDPKVIFTGRLSNSELIAHYLAMDVFCFPSITKNEAFGLALAESMSFGKPCVTFKIPGSGVNFVNLDRVTGIECPNRDAAAFAQAIRSLRDDSDMRREYGFNARERAGTLFGFTEFQKRIRDVVVRNGNEGN